MSSITHFFDDTIVIKRLKTVSGNRKNYTATLTIEGHIQVLSSKFQRDEAQYYGAFGATHKCWVGAESTAQEGDKAVDSKGYIYDVVIVNEKTYGFAMNVHKELILKRAKHVDD